MKIFVSVLYQKVPKGTLWHTTFEMKHLRVGDKLMWAVPLLFNQDSLPPAHGTRFLDKVPLPLNTLLDLKYTTNRKDVDCINALSPLVNSPPLPSVYPDTDYMWSIIHILPRPFMYQETFAAKTWEVYNSEIYVSNDNKLFVESHILFGRISDMTLASDYTNGSLLGLELDRWIDEVCRERWCIYCSLTVASIRLTSVRHWKDGGHTTSRRLIPMKESGSCECN